MANVKTQTPARKTPAKAPAVKKQVKATKRNAKVAMGVVAQVVLASRKENRLAAFLGALLGGFVPLATYVVAHYETGSVVSLGSLLVLGGLAYSAKTVYEWGSLAFKSAWKAAGFVLLIEGVMVLSGNWMLSVVALCYLMAINGVATGCTLALEKK